MEDVLERECNIYKKTDMAFRPTMSNMLSFPYKFRLFAGFACVFGAQASGSCLLVFYSTDVFEVFSEYNKYILTSFVGLTNIAGKV